MAEHRELPVTQKPQAQKLLTEVDKKRRNESRLQILTGCLAGGTILTAALIIYRLLTRKDVALASGANGAQERTPNVGESKRKKMKTKETKDYGQNALSERTPTRTPTSLNQVPATQVPVQPTQAPVQPSQALVQPSQAPVQPSQTVQSQAPQPYLYEWRSNIVSVRPTFDRNQLYIPDVLPSNTVLELKQRVFQRIPIPVHQQRLVLADRLMRDDEFLGNFDFRTYEMAHLVVIRDPDNSSISPDLTFNFTIMIRGHPDISLAARLDDTIESVRQRLAQSRGVTSDRVQLYHYGERLSDGTIGQASIRPNSTVVAEIRDPVATPLPQNVRISVKFQNDRVMSLNVNTADLVSSLRRIVAEREHVGTDRVTLVFSGRRLEDQHPLGHYNIRDGIIVNGIIRTLPPPNIEATPEPPQTPQPTVQVTPQHTNQVTPQPSQTQAAPRDHSWGRTSIYIRTLTGLPIYIQDILASQTVLNMKERIAAGWGFPIDRQRLICAGREMQDSDLLGIYNLPNYATLHLVIRDNQNDPQSPSRIVYNWTTSPARIRYSAGRTFTIDDVSVRETVFNLKEKIAAKEGIAVNRQRLVYRGTDMNDEEPLSYYDLPSIDALILYVLHNENN